MRDGFLIFGVGEAHPLERAGSEPDATRADRDDVVGVLRTHLVTRIGVGA
jgi:hypothetical protein